MIVIVDYGMGNTGSILTKLERMGAEAAISGRIEDIERADKLILPGVGAFDSAMTRLEKLGMTSLLKSKVVDGKTPILGICLGMQLFTKRSDEGRLNGLGWIDAETKRISPHDGMKIPHMGWNTIRICGDTPIMKDIPDGSRFYFVHSYRVCCSDGRDSKAMTGYGDDFTSVVQNGNIYGVQFHPEKSHNAGIRVIRNFVDI